MNTGIDNADRVRSSVALRTLVHNAAQMAEPLFRRRSAALRVCASKAARAAEGNTSGPGLDASLNRSELHSVLHRDSSDTCVEAGRVCVNTDVGRVTHVLLNLLACAARRACAARAASTLPRAVKAAQDGSNTFSNKNGRRDRPIYRWTDDRTTPDPVLRADAQKQ